jgi:hypothetical protein
MGRDVNLVPLVIPYPTRIAAAVHIVSLLDILGLPDVVIVVIHSTPLIVSAMTASVMITSDLDTDLSVSRCE